MRFKLLGLLEVDDASKDIPLPRGKERALLAALLIRANEPVSTDRLIDELWGERPPEHAAKTVQVYVSRLRKALGAERLATTPAGYVVRAGEDELDAREFERLAREGREAFAAGDTKRAAALLEEAEALWRGPALADFRFEPFAQAEIRRLEELRAGTRADLVDVRLARGEADAVIAELEQLVAENPLWERPRRQLMLALYRSGRQADALELYRRTRSLLAEELAIEPSPELQELERAILNQDPALAGPQIGVRLATARRGAALLVAGGVVVVVALAIAAFQLARSDSGPSTLPPRQGSAIALDARAGHVERRIRAGTTPAAVDASSGAVWLVDADARTVLRVDPSSGETDTLATGATPLDIVADGRSAWVVNGEQLEKAQFVGPVATTVAKLEPATGAAEVETRLPRAAHLAWAPTENIIAVKGGAVWAVAPNAAVVRIDAANGTVTATTRGVYAVAVAAGAEGVWALSPDGTLVRLNEKSARPVARVRIPASSVTGIAVGDDAVWITSSTDGSLWRVAARGRPSLGKIDLAKGVADVAVGPDAVWVVNPLAGTVVQVDPKTATVTRTVDVDAVPRSVAVSGDTVWLAAVAEPEASRTELQKIHPFLAPACDPVIAGKDAADVLVVSDFPLQSGTRVQTAQMARAIAFVLREHGFRAGRFRIAYQSCDDSLARSGIFDDTKCAANARAYGDNGDVVAVIGTFNSPCALDELPVLNSARDGPLAMVSPSNSFPGLTRSGVGIDPSLPASLYPTGHRNYFRVYPTDDLQGAALAMLARDHGRKRVFVLDDGDQGYALTIVQGFERAARRVGLDVVGRATWNPRAAGYRALVERVARRHPQAVFVGGLLDANAARVIHDLRARLGRSVDLLGPDGLTPLPLLVDQAGPAAYGTYVSLAGIVTQVLPPAGKRFVRRFGRTQTGGDVDPFSVYAAQATEVLLQAIARSDGTRASVVRQLFRTRVRNGLLGTFAFNANGDITESPVTIVRVHGRGHSLALESIEGGVVDRVVRPSQKLVAPAN